MKAILHTNREDLLFNLTSKLKETPLIVNNSGASLKRNFERVYNSPIPMTFSQSINFLVDTAKMFDTKILYVMHEDIDIDQNILFRFEEFCSKLDGLWSCVLTNEDSLCAYNMNIFKMIQFDTNLPAYYADTDFQYWCSILGYPPIQSNITFKHFRSQTIMSDPRKLFENSITFPLYTEYYRQKTGGSKGQEIFKLPFNNKMYEDIAIW